MLLATWHDPPATDQVKKNTAVDAGFNVSRCAGAPMAPPRAGIGVTVANTDDDPPEADAPLGDTLGYPFMVHAPADELVIVKVSTRELPVNFVAVAATFRSGVMHGPPTPVTVTGGTATGGRSVTAGTVATVGGVVTPLGGTTRGNVVEAELSVVDPILVVVVVLAENPAGLGLPPAPLQPPIATSAPKAVSHPRRLQNGRPPSRDRPWY